MADKFLLAFFKLFFELSPNTVEFKTEIFIFHVTENHGNHAKPLKKEIWSNHGKSWNSTGITEMRRILKKNHGNDVNQNEVV